MLKTAGFYLCLALGMLLAAWASLTPRVVPEDAAPGAFSAARAFADVQEIAKAPHPLGSAENARVRAYLVQRLTAMGLAPEVFNDTAVVHGPHRFAQIAPVADIVVRLPGKNPALPAVLVMSHYDTVPASPGAADNSAGVAAALEIARALRAGPEPERDVIFLITDGEEIALLGADAFFKDSPLAGHIGAVVNFEARGVSGQSVMYETGKNNAGMIALFAAGARHFSANSLASLLYGRMPNGSDFTIAKERGLPGLNFAFIGDELGYHTPYATPARLNRGSLQQLGDQALPVVRALALAKTLPPQTARSVYSDLFGFKLIAYPPWQGWLLLALAAALIASGLAAGRFAAPLSPMALLRATGGSLLAILTPVLLLWPAGKIIAQLDHMQRLPHYDYVFAAMLLLAFAALAYTVFALRTGKGRIVLSVAALMAAALSCLDGFSGTALLLAVSVIALCWISIYRTLTAVDLARGSLCLALVPGIVLQALAPEATPLFVWPLLAAALAFALGQALAKLSTGIAAAAAVTALAWVGAFASQLFLGLGVDLPFLIAVPLLAALPCLMPVLAEASDEDAAPYAALALLVLGAGALTYARLAPATAERPLPSMVLHLQNLDSNEAWRVAGLTSLDPWSKAALKTPVYAPLPGISEDAVWAAPTHPAALPRPELTLARNNGLLTLYADAGENITALRLYLRSSVALDSLAVAGKPLKETVPAGRWVIIDATKPENLYWVLKAPAHARIEVRLRVSRAQWPADAEPLPPVPRNVMPVYSSGYSQTFSATQTEW
jgi:hypothetical protein